MPGTIPRCPSASSNSSHDGKPCCGDHGDKHHDKHSHEHKDHSGIGHRTPHLGHGGSNTHPLPFPLPLPRQPKPSGYGNKPPKRFDWAELAESWSQAKPNQHNAHNGGCDPGATPPRPHSCSPYEQHTHGHHGCHPQVYTPAAVVPPAPSSAPFTYNAQAPYQCQPHVCGPHAACAAQLCGPAHAHVHPNGNCHDVSLLLAHMNALALPKIKYACAPHPPLSVCLPTDTSRVPASFCFDARLVRDELHHPLLCYLAEGVAPGILTTGPAGTKIHTAHRLLADERPDGYRALQCLVYAHVLLSLNVLLLEDAPRNACLDARRIWTVTSPCAAAASPAASGLELQVAGKAAVALEVHPTNVISNCLMDAILNTVKCGALFDCGRGRVVADPHGDPLLYADALAVLTQVWCRFASDVARKDSPIKWVVLSNLERTIVFHRRAQHISVSHVICGDGVSNPRNACQNLYSTLLALSVLEKHQYQAPGAGFIELVQLL